MVSRGPELILSAGIILITSVAIAGFIANASAIHLTTSNSLPLPAPQKGGVAVFTPSAGGAGSTPVIGILILGGMLLLAAFLMVWMRDRFVTSLKEMILILSLTLLGTFVYGILSSFFRFPSVIFSPSRSEYFVVTAVILIAILTAVYLNKQRKIVSCMPANFSRDDEVIESQIKDEVYRLAKKERDAMRRQIYICYAKLVSRAEEAGVLSHESLTPREYLEGIKGSIPDIYSEAASLTAAFEEARYSLKLISSDMVQRALTSIGKIEERLSKRNGE